jgi:hypothetical protein
MNTTSPNRSANAPAPSDTGERADSASSQRKPFVAPKLHSESDLVSGTAERTFAFGTQS